MNFPDHIFKAYDIRGLVEGELSLDLAYKIGRAFVQLLRSENTPFEGKKLIVGYDMRPSSQPFKEELIRAITDEGVDVLDIGMVSTPLFNFVCAHFPEHVGGIVVTASHNPAQYNGFKLTRGDGLPVGKGTGMDEIREMVKKGTFEDSQKKGKVVEKDMTEAYLEKVLSFVDVKAIKPLTVVIDYGNGMGSVTFERLFKKLPIKVHTLYQEPDGRFPNHEANPVKLDTLKDLQAKVVEVRADFGFALDGDADRIGVVDEKGEIVDASFVGALLGLEVLKLHPGMHMIYSLLCSQIVKEVWEQQGATTEMGMVGHALIKNMMRQVKAGFASELSLHIFYGDLYNLESSDLSFLYYLQILSRENKPLSEVVAPLKKYFHSGEINFEVQKKDEAMKKIEETFQEQATEIFHLDGLWMRFPWGWFSIRKSNTEPLLRLNVEGVTLEDMERYVNEVSVLIKEVE